VACSLGGQPATETGETDGERRVKETDLRKAIVALYDWAEVERLRYIELWDATVDAEQKVYYGEKASTYTSVKMYMRKFFSNLIDFEQTPEERAYGLRSAVQDRERDWQAKVPHAGAD